MSYPPDTYVPTLIEAERDVHEASPCSWQHPCPACERTTRR